eukprot:375624-Alexandrium_andersonii.AAC.1
MRASGGIVFGTASLCGSAGCVWRLSPKEYAEAVAPKMTVAGRKGFLPITVGKNLLRGGSIGSPGLELLHFVLILNGGLGEVNGFCRDSLPRCGFPIPSSGNAAPAFIHCCCCLLYTSPSPRD